MHYLPSHLAIFRLIRSRKRKAAKLRKERALLYLKKLMPLRRSIWVKQFKKLAQKHATSLFGSNSSRKIKSFYICAKNRQQKALALFWKTSPYSFKISTSSLFFKANKKFIVPHLFISKKKYKKALPNTKLSNPWYFSHVKRDKYGVFDETSKSFIYSKYVSKFFSTNLSKIAAFLKTLNTTNRYLLFKYLYAFAWASKWISFLNLEKSLQLKLSSEIFSTFSLARQNYILKHFTLSEFLFLCNLKETMFFRDYNTMLENPELAVKMFLGCTDVMEFMKDFKITSDVQLTIADAFHNLRSSASSKVFSFNANNINYINDYTWSPTSRLYFLMGWLLPFFSLNSGNLSSFSAFSKTNFLNNLKMSYCLNEQCEPMLSLPNDLIRSKWNLANFGALTPVFFNGLTDLEKISLSVQLDKEPVIQGWDYIFDEINLKDENILLMENSYNFLSYKTKSISTGSLELLNDVDVDFVKEQDFLYELDNEFKFKPTGFQFNINIQVNNFFCNFSKVEDDLISKTIFKMSSASLKESHYSKRTARFWMKKLILQFFKRSLSWLKKKNLIKAGSIPIEERLNVWFNFTVPVTLNRFLINQLKRDFNYNYYNVFINFKPLLCFNGCRAKTLQSKKRKGRVTYKFGGK